MATAEQIELLTHVSNVYGLMINKKFLNPNGLHLSKVAVVQAVDNALKDMSRMSEFHLDVGKKPDRHKYAGFIAKWIAKCRPIQLDENEPTNLNVQRLWANAKFATFIMASFLDMKTIDSHLAQYLEYWFQFREERGETLSLVGYCWEDMGRRDCVPATQAASSA